MQEAFDWNEEPPLDPAIEYQGLLRGLRRKRGFGLYFVQCSPAEGTKLIARIREDLPKIEVLKFDAAMDGNFYQCVADYLQAHGDTEVLFVQGLEYSLLSYEATKREEGWSSEEIYSYSWKAVPRLLGNLNLQRERFRDNFPIRFVFLLPSFAMKYLIRRAPDFFDWRSGIFEIPSDSELIEQESLRLVQEGGYKEYLSWTQPKRDCRIAEIQCWIGESNQTPDRRAQLFLKQGNLFAASDEYEAAIASYDQALKYKLDDDSAWYNRGFALGRLQRYEEAIANYDKAIEFKPDNSIESQLSSYRLWHNRGFALLNLGRYEEAIASYDKAIEFKPDNSIEFQLGNRRLWHNRGFALLNLGRYEEAIANYDKAIEFKSDNSIEFQSSDYWVWHGRGFALLNLGRYEEAIASYDKAIEFKPDNSIEFQLGNRRLWHNRGFALSNLERYEEAIASYDKAIEFKPNNAHTIYNKACCYGCQDQAELAIANLKQAIDLDPKYREMAKTDADFERVRSDDRFQALIQGQPK